ncbi:reverse transcriptase, partial [Pyrenophora tritici-repentis]
MASEQERKAWGEALVEGLANYPALIPVALAGLDANPKPLTDLFMVPQNADVKAAFEAILQNTQEAFTHLTLSNTAELDTRDQHIQNLQDNIQRLTIECNLLKTMALNAPTRSGNVKRSTQDPPAFTGGETNISKSQNDFLTWRTKITGNLLVDADVFNSEFKKIHYLSTVLTGSAYEICRDNFEKITNNQHNPELWPWKTAQEVVQNLTHRFVTLDLSRQAIIDLENLEMKNAPYANFKSKFDILSARADMTDVQKVRLLKEKVSRELQETSMNRGNQPEKDDITAWSKRFQDIWEDRLDFKHQETKKAKRATHLQPLHIAPAQVVMDQGDPMVLDAFKDPKISRD